MLPRCTRTAFRVCATVAVLVPALWGCTGKGGGGFDARGVTPGGEPTVSEGSVVDVGGLTMTLTAAPLVAAGVGLSAGTAPGGMRLAALPRNNPRADDLLDHWGHRRVPGIAEGFSLTSPEDGNGAEELRTLRAAVRTDDEASAAPDLHDGDEVRVLGSRRGITYGRWAGGPADTLSIDFTLSPGMQEKPGVRALVERAGKVWTGRIADTWSAWHRAAGDLKGWLINGTSAEIEVRVGEGGEVSTGLEIDIRERYLPADVAGWANEGIRPSGSWEPRFGSIEVHTPHLEKAPETHLFATLAHEIGHVLGAWKGGAVSESYAPYTDMEAGTWTGPNVAAVYGGPAPFQDLADPKAWIGGRRDPSASQFDFAHSGVCVSLMSYCRQNAAQPSLLPHAIDFAFLADLGLTITEETLRPETYGLAGWTGHAAFTLSVSRDLRVALADPQPYYDGAANIAQTLDMVDLLRVGVDVFGHRSTGDILQSHAAVGVAGTVRYAGGLIGAAIDRAALPPVTGDASLALDLGTLDGRASFTSLAVHAGGTSEVFAGGRLYYPFELSANAITGTGEGSTLRADFYGPAHGDVAGALHDPTAGLLASFGATVDDRSTREEVVAAAGYLAGLAYRRASADPAEDGWYQYRCEGASGCESRHGPSSGWTAWADTTRDSVLAATAGWDSRSGARLDSDRGFARIERQTSADTDGGRGRHVMDGYTGTLEHAAFATGFETYTDGWAGAGGTGGFHRRWAGVQGSLSGSAPGEVARWSGPMLGYESGHAANEAAFVEGRATVAYSLGDSRVSVGFSEVVSRDGRRQLDDFGFEDLRLDSDGTFAGGGSTGAVNGAFFGPSHAEAAGAFHHNSARVTGGFGARRMPDTATLHESGTVGPLDHFLAYDDWGFWGTQFGDSLFGAFVTQRVDDLGGGRRSYYAPGGRVSGTPAGNNPASGSAVWSGKVRAVDASDNRWTPVSGDARLEVDFGRATIDVDFTELEAGHGDMSWRALRIRNGAFAHTQGSDSLSGAFYGIRHKGAAGTFRRDGLRGVFGAARQPDAGP
ncbi:MAG: hypothetical protein OXU42_11535 [Deltaproteobacteria bacterium]|nr:hypothetical protein [Deltaproteobacteria bacterium]